jgi:hypothetical protein
MVVMLRTWLLGVVAGAVLGGMLFMLGSMATRRVRRGRRE